MNGREIGVYNLYGLQETTPNAIYVGMFRSVFATKNNLANI